MIIADGKLGLIDFEHFIFAPRELEFCNSLFFNDGNCLDVIKIVRLFPLGFLDKQMLKRMLKFYGLKQINLGMSQSEAEIRTYQGIKKIESLVFGREKPIFNMSKTSFCFT